MNKVTLKSIFVGLLITPTIFYSKEKKTIVFTENKGQIHDQNYNARPDILYAATDGKMVFHFKKNGLSYQLASINSSDNIHQKTVYRIDVNWLNAKTNTNIKSGVPQEGYLNFYSECCPNGALNVKSYENITYENLYNGINLKWYQKDGHLKYDYLVSAGSNYKQIKLEFKGAQKIYLAENGELHIKTPLGEIVEQSPLVRQKNKTLKSTWVIKNKTVSFEIEGLSEKEPYIIDPLVRVWGTYYGTASIDSVKSCRTDNIGNVYIVGNTSGGTGTEIATTGSHQTSIGSLGNTDAYLAKFSSTGLRLWGTYYGTSNQEQGEACAVDGSNNVFMVGHAGNSSGSIIATPGSHQPNWAGGGIGYEAFIVKFNSSGIRQWATWYGGNTGHEFATSCAADATGNLYVSGFTSSTGATTAIATPGAHQTANGGSSDGYLVKFNGSGVRQWATFYGGSGIDAINSCNVNSTGDVLISGRTASPTTTLIASAGSHQTSFGSGTTDAFIARFNTNGVRQWATYYGGLANDIGYGCAIDPIGNCYLSGTTNSGGSIISSPGSHQSVQSSGNEAFLVKFNSTGVRQWGTYYGGTAADNGRECAIDPSGNVYLTGFSGSNGTAIATPGNYQSLNAGGIDGFIAKFDGNGIRLFGSFYGGVNDDHAYGIALDAANNIYIAGVTESSAVNVIASSGGHQNTYGGTRDGFLVQLFDCITPAPPTNSTPIPNQTRCPNTTTTLSATGSGTINWYTSPTSTTVLFSGSNYITPTLTTGTYTYYAEALTCVSSATRTPITLTVVSNPTITVNSGVVCPGKTFTIIPSGGLTYTYSSGSNTVSPTSNTSYTVTGSNAQGCANTAISSVSVNATPTINVSGGSVCPGGSFTINPSGASTYTYSNGQVVTPSTTTNYTVTGTSAQGCTATPVIITVTYTNSLTVGIVGSNTVCSGQPLVLTGSGASTYTWNTSATTNSISVSPTSNTTYSVIGASSTCSNTALISVTVMPNPTVTLSSSQPSVMCSGQSATLSASGASSYSWNTGSTSPSIVVSPTTTTTYTVLGTNSSGCSITSILTQSVNTCTDMSFNLMNQSTKTIIYPNPANEVLFVEVKTQADYELTDAAGRLILKGMLINGINKLNLAELSQGMYFIKITSLNNSKEDFKIIK